MQRIVRNSIRCKMCNDIILCNSRHDFQSCQCGAVAVDGGLDYLRRIGTQEDWEELSIFEDEKSDE